MGDGKGSSSPGLCRASHARVQLWGLPGSFCGYRLGSTERGCRSAVREKRRVLSFFSWPSEDSKTKLMLIPFTSEPKELPECSLNSLLREGCVCNVHRTWGPGVLWTWSCCWSWLFDGALVAEWTAGFAVVRATQEWCSGVPVGTSGSDPPPGRHEGSPRGQ